MSESDYPYHGDPELPRHEKEPDHDAHRARRRPRREAAPIIVQQTSMFGVLSMVIGGIGLSIAVIPCFGVFGMIGGALGLLLGLIGMAEARSSRGRISGGVPVAGTLISLTGLAVGGAWLMLMAGMFNKNPRGGPELPDGNADVPAFTLTAVDLDQEYDANEVAADAKYLGKRIQVTGRVKQVTDTREPGRMTLELVGIPESTVNCAFPMSEKIKLDRLNDGQEVTVRALCRGKKRGSVTLEECTRVLSDEEKQAESAPPIRVLAAVLASEYLEDSDSADTKYKGRQVLITGRLGKVARNVPGKVTVKLEDDEGENLLSCVFKIEAEKPLAMLKQGQRVVIRGRCLGEIEDTLTISDCTLEK